METGQQLTSFVSRDIAKQATVGSDPLDFLQRRSPLGRFIDTCPHEVAGKRVPPLGRQDLGGRGAFLSQRLSRLERLDTLAQLLEPLELARGVEIGATKGVRIGLDQTGDRLTETCGQLSAELA